AGGGGGLWVRSLPLCRGARSCAGIFFFPCIGCLNSWICIVCIALLLYVRRFVIVFILFGCCRFDFCDWDSFVVSCHARCCCEIEA
uniref:Uncharacterized protein n=1 Tax=Aegilops tauschii subsp. strangulata TaxID=200361 RepID=A0A453ESR1_AEGTS